MPWCMAAPIPASTNFGATSVGTLAIRRFLRPVCYQNMPDALLPQDLTRHGRSVIQPQDGGRGSQIRTG